MEKIIIKRRFIGKYLEKRNKIVTFVENIILDV